MTFYVWNGKGITEIAIPKKDFVDHRDGIIDTFRAFDNGYLDVDDCRPRNRQGTD